MSQQNAAELRYTQEWIDTFRGHITAALAMLQEKSVSLTPPQRSELPTLGLINTEMVNTGVRLIESNPSWFPGDFDRAEVLADSADRGLLQPAASDVSKLAELFNDTMHAIGSDLLMGVYAASPYIRQGTKLTGEGSEQVAEFVKYFKRNRKKPAPAESPTAE